jgi:hypothetical protein
MPLIGGDASNRGGVSFDRLTTICGVPSKRAGVIGKLIYDINFQFFYILKKIVI